MPDIEQLTRERFRAIDQIMAADSQQVIRQVVRARRLRTTLTALTAATAALLVAMGGIAGAAALRGHPKRTQLPPAAPSSNGYSEGPAVPSTPMSSTIPADTRGRFNRILAINFADRNNGYAYMRSCKSPGVECEARLVATTDAGNSWTQRAIPNGPIDIAAAPLPALVVAGPKTLVLNMNSGNEQTTRNTDHWLSRDGGLSWHHIETLPTTQLSSLPQGSVLFHFNYGGVVLKEQVQVFSPAGFAGILPSAIESAPDAGTIADGAAGYSIVVGQDQSLWVPCVVKVDGALPEACVKLSRDRGKTWSTLRPAQNTEHAASTVTAVSTVDGKSIYLSTGMNNAKVALVYASADGGATWKVSPTTGMPAECGDLRVEAMPDGSTVAMCGSTLYRKAAGQDTYQAIPGLPGGLSNFGHTGSWLVVSRMATNASALIMSEDGVNWKETPL